ncbi:MAG: DUF2155 domain-containing protein [Acetobacteraceae bacterium]|nr:DUF2155 domain-containing protein [Acetobacteraceae bacterium]
MRVLWVGMLLASLPFSLMAQRTFTPGQRAPGDAIFIPVPPTPVEPPPPDDVVTVAPLPPPDQFSRPGEEPAQEDMVPNPLRDPSATPGPGPRKSAQPQGQPQRGGWVPMGTATLQVLDKVNARGETMTVKTGDTGRFGSLEIAVRGCYIRTPDRPIDATALLVIRDRRTGAPGFTGWMVRSAPYMSMMAHPIYDVRVVGCAP